MSVTLAVPPRNGSRMASEQLLNGIPSGSGGIPKVRPERLSVTRYAKVTPPSGRYYLGALAAHWRFAGGGARRLAPFENPFKTTLYDKRQAEYTLPARGQAHRVCQRQGHPGAEAAYPAAGREVRHDRQQLHTGKGFRLQAESEADGKAGGRHGDPHRLPQRPDKLHVRAPRHGPREAQTDVRQLPVHARVAQGTGQAGGAHHRRARQGTALQPPARRDKER